MLDAVYSPPTRVASVLPSITTAVAGEFCFHVHRAYFYSVLLLGMPLNEQIRLSKSGFGPAMLVAFHRMLPVAPRASIQTIG